MSSAAERPLCEVGDDELEPGPSKPVPYYHACLNQLLGGEEFQPGTSKDEKESKEMQDMQKKIDAFRTLLINKYSGKVDNASDLINDYITQVVDHFKKKWKEVPNLKILDQIYLPESPQCENESLHRYTKTRLDVKLNQEYCHAFHNLNGMEEDLMSFLHLHYPDVKDSIYNHARWEAVQKELVRENMFEDFVEAAGLREDLMEKLKAEPVLQLLFQSWDKIKSNIENEDAYKALSSIDIDYVFRDYDHSFTDKAMDALKRCHLPSTVWCEKYPQACNMYSSYFNLNVTKDKFMKFLTEFKILKSSQWNEVEPLLWKEYQKEILMFKRLLRYWFNEKMNEGCMVCRQRTRLTSEMIKRELPILKRGDHIEMPLKDSIFGTFLKHHAIVDSYKVGEEFVQDPELYVVEVSRDVDQSNQNERVEQCNAKKQKKIEIKRNKYDGKLEDITLIEYRKRKYHHTDTYNRAMSFVGNKSNYNLVLKNCEHFTAACVNGEHTLSIDNWKSVSVQTLQLFWAIVDILFAVFQCAFFYHNFTDWMFGYLWAATLGTCEGVFLALFLFFFVLEYFLFKPNTRVCVCSECLTARYIMFVVKALLFAIIEIGNEFLVQPFFYDKDCVKLVSLSLPEILSIVEGVSIMFIAPRLTKVVIFFLGSKRLKWLWNICKFEEDAYKHVLHYISLHDIDVAVKNCFLMCGTSIFRPSRTTTDPDDLINEYDWS